MTTALERIRSAHASPRARPGRRGKAFSEPPFWALDSLRNSFLGSLPDRERIEHEFEGYARGAGKASAVAFSCFYARLRHYAQASFQWQNRASGQLFGTPELALVEQPWPTGTTGDLLAWMEVDATFAGNSYWTHTDDEGRFGRAARGPSRRLTRMRPDWVWIVLSSKSGDPYALDTKIVAFVYDPRVSGLGGTVTASSERLVTLLPSEVVHYAPVPDPEARFRGMSWLTPILREVAADRAATAHKLSFFERGATLRTIVALDKDVSVEAFDEFVERFQSQHQGVENAFGTLFVGGGADVTVTSANLHELDYKAVQGQGETRIAAAAGVHPVIVGLSEGLAGSSLNAGNYRAAVRNFGDGTCTHLWQVTSASLQNVLTVPGGARLAVDKTAIPFLAEDAKDRAEIQQILASAYQALVSAGAEPDAAAEYLRSNDLGKLIGHHTGLFSVQLQPPTTGQPVEPATGGPGLASHNGHDRKELLAMAERW